MVLWLIGLSGSGKSTLAREVCRMWKTREPQTVLVDGDDVREMLGSDRGDTDYTITARRRNAERICRLCAWLDGQGFNVVTAILSIFQESRDWNRAHYSSYYEVFLDVPMDMLLQRDTKSLYAPALRGERRDVVGVDIAFPRPTAADETFSNEQGLDDVPRVASGILERALMKRDRVGVA